MLRITLLVDFIFLEDDDANSEETLVVVFLTCLNFCHRLKVLGTLSASWRTALLLRLPRFLRQSKGTVFFGSFLAVASTAALLWIREIRFVLNLVFCIVRLRNDQITKLHI